MEKRNNPAAEHCRDWKETLKDVMLLITMVIFGVAIDIGLCKFWPEFWWFVNWGLSA